MRDLSHLRTHGVDVIVPCYNYGRYLDACVGSVLRGLMRPTRVLIIDDASTDDTPKIASALVASHPNVFYVRHQTNIGHIATYNEGIQWAEGQYLILLSADDLLAPAALARAAFFFDTHPQVGLVYGRTHAFRGDAPGSLPEPADYRSHVIEGVDFIRSTFADGRNPVASPAAVMVRTGLQKEIGGYRPDLPYAGDLEMYLRCAARAAVGHLDVVQGLYRQHASNMSHGYRDLRDYEQRLLAFESISLRHRESLPDHADLLRRAKGTMAMELFWTANRAFEESARDSSVNIDACLSLAASMDQSIVRSPSWRRLRIKRMVGREWARRATSAISIARQGINAGVGPRP